MAGEEAGGLSPEQRDAVLRELAQVNRRLGALERKLDRMLWLRLRADRLRAGAVGEARARLGSNR